MNTSHATPTQVKLVAVGRMNGTHTELRTDPTFAPALIIVSAYDMGKRDGEAGNPFAPEAWYGAGVHRIDYCRGFLAAQPDNKAAQSYRDGFISNGYDLFWANKPFDKCWNTFMRQGWMEAQDEWGHMEAEKVAKPGLQGEPNWVALAEDEIVGS